MASFCTYASEKWGVFPALEYTTVEQTYVKSPLQGTLDPTSRAFLLFGDDFSLIMVSCVRLTSAWDKSILVFYFIGEEVHKYKVVRLLSV